MQIQCRPCVVSAYTSAGAFIVSTQPSVFYGITAYGSAAATTINIKNGLTTAGTNVAIFPIGITAGVFQTICPGIVCRTGIVATNIGTVAGYAVFYSTV